MIVICLEMMREDPSGPVFMQRCKHVETVTPQIIADCQNEFEVDGWRLSNWNSVEQLPYDEGFQASANNENEFANPYASHFWKHNEWALGWDAHQRGVKN